MQSQPFCRAYLKILKAGETNATSTSCLLFRSDEDHRDLTSKSKITRMKKELQQQPVKPPVPHDPPWHRPRNNPSQNSFLDYWPLLHFPSEQWTGKSQIIKVVTALFEKSALTQEWHLPTSVEAPLVL